MAGNEEEALQASVSELRVLVAQLGEALGKQAGAERFTAPVFSHQNASVVVQGGAVWWRHDTAGGFPTTPTERMTAEQLVGAVHGLRIIATQVSVRRRLALVEDAAWFANNLLRYIDEENAEKERGDG